MTAIVPLHKYSVASLANTIQFTARHRGGWPIDEIMELRRRLDEGVVTESELPPDVLALVINPPPDPLGGAPRP